MDLFRDRYKMNSGVLTFGDMKALEEKKVVIVGLGGLGGNVANQLVRLGVLHITLIDFDVFTESNLNRQLFSNTENIGKNKVELIKEELLKINPELDINVFSKRVHDVVIEETDYIIDCVDNMETRMYLSNLSKTLNVPLLHGSCGGWYGQVGWMSPNSTLIDEMYNEDEGLEKELLNPVFAPSVVASFMVSEFVKMIKNSPSMVLDKLLLIDLYNNALLKTGR